MTAGGRLSIGGTGTARRTLWMDVDTLHREDEPEPASGTKQLMGTYGETVRRATLPPTSFKAAQPADDKRTFKCDMCVAPSVAVVVVGEGPSALSLEFCGHHLALQSAKLADGGHKVVFHP
jgi:hypothetical protein